MINTEKFDSGGPGLFLRGQNIYLLFNSDVVYFLLKTNGGETEGLVLLFLWFRVLCRWVAK